MLGWLITIAIASPIAYLLWPSSYERHLAREQNLAHKLAQLNCLLMQELNRENRE